MWDEALLFLVPFWCQIFDAFIVLRWATVAHMGLLLMKHQGYMHVCPFKILHIVSRSLTLISIGCVSGLLTFPTTIIQNSNFKVIDIVTFPLQVCCDSVIWSQGNWYFTLSITDSHWPLTLFITDKLWFLHLMSRSSGKLRKWQTV